VNESVDPGPIGTRRAGLLQGRLEDAKDRRIAELESACAFEHQGRVNLGERVAELEKDVTRLEAQLDASVLEDALDSEARLAARVHKLEAERQEWADKRQALEVRIGTKDRRITELEAERDRLRAALARIEHYPFEVMREAYEDRAGMYEIARAALAGVSGGCICPSHASNRGECPIHDHKGRPR
jgi:chromosome segregation ATPase